ncbi:MAG TPA: excinuclease ABC subunit UvrA [Candidatus Binataceae bacterium]|nr:excinuclease ABC subunit UvrA [Candidatus Binataceae bacterium]
MSGVERTISIRGARTHNLKSISLDLPRDRLIVVTGVSGSGKSSLVFDTLYAEGQRRYVQSLSTYARMFLQRMDRPDVDAISEIPPALALRQKNTIKNARSTVGTVTEISDYLRLLFATLGRTTCPRCGGSVTRDTVESAAAHALSAPGMQLFLAPFEPGSRTTAAAYEFLAQNGYHRLYLDGAIVETAELLGRAVQTVLRDSTTGIDAAGAAETPRYAMNGDAAPANGAGAPDASATARNGVAPLMVVTDRVATDAGDAGARVREALEKAFYLGGGRARIVTLVRDNGKLRSVAEAAFDRRFNCSRCGTLFVEPTPALFSANSPIGACPECEGFGRTVELDLEKVIPDSGLSLRQGLIAPWRTPAYQEMKTWMLKCARRARVRAAVPFREMTEAERSWLLDGEPRGARSENARGEEWERWPGVRGFFRWMEKRRYKTHVRILLARYRRFVPCPACGGAKLRPEALNVRVAGMTIAEVGQLAVRELKGWLERLAQEPSAAERAGVVLRELASRVGYLDEVGLGYLTVERQARTLSGGEAQRIHLASALGSLLTATMYVLDEPTVGLHAGDVRRLLGVLRRLRDLGNTVVVVEHDPMMIAGADYTVELGPGGGREGGHLVRAGVPDGGAKRARQRAQGARARKPIKPAADGADALNGATPGRVMLMRTLARERRFSRSDPALRIVGAREHNLRNLDLRIPLGRMVCVTGVSGSGKSTLVEDVLYNNYLRRRGEPVSEVGACDRIEGLELIGEMVHMGQELPARSLRSNPATYLKIYDDIRRLFAQGNEARRQGIQARHFSFNVDGGRCEKCHGTGTVTIEMHFMADLEVQCDACDGRRFQSHILAIRYQGHNVNQVLGLTIDEARAFFARSPAIVRRLEALSAVGLGYLCLGQSTSTLSGGEAQRLKLARFLLADLEPLPAAADGRQAKPLGRVFLLDEPTTGLSSADTRQLLRVLSRLVAEGNTLIIIEHNLEFIAHADYVIDLGPGGGEDGGRVVAAGPPLKIAAAARSLTGRELRGVFGLPAGAPRAAARSARMRASAG